MQILDSIKIFNYCTSRAKAKCSCKRFITAPSLWLLATVVASLNTDIHEEHSGHPLKAERTPAATSHPAQSIDNNVMRGLCFECFASNRCKNCKLEIAQLLYTQDAVTKQNV